jgi:hypothetical protein
MGVLYMLKDLIEQGFGEKEDLNCAEKILWGANTVVRQTNLQAFRQDKLQ